MTTNKTLIQAIAEFQKAAPIILKSATNPFFKSKYADLPAVWHTIHDLMSANGLIVVNMNVIIDGAEHLETRIYHTSGEYISSVSKLSPVKNDPQSVGSAITYMRRYALMSLLGLVADDDDDGNAASGKDNKPKPADKAKEQVKKELTPEQIAERDKLMEKVQPIITAINQSGTERSLNAVIKLHDETINGLPEAWKNRILDIADEKRVSFSTLNAG